MGGSGKDKIAGIMLYTFDGKKPVIAKNAFIAETACIIGNVTIGEKSSVWFNSVIRGDRAKIRIGKGCNIQDNAVIHSDDRNVEIGDWVSMGHGSVMHGCTVKNNALIGMNATVLHGAEIGEFAIVAAGALVPPGHKIPARSVVMGVPCKHVRMTTEEDIMLIKNTLRNYEILTERYLSSSQMKNNKMNINNELIRTRTNSGGVSSYQFVRVSCFSYQSAKHS